MCQRLTYEEFVQKLRKWIIKDAHLPEDYVFLKKKEKTGITANGDRLFVVCAETDSGKDICGIFVEELYQDYVEGTSMENIEARVKCDLDRVGNMENTRYLTDYEKVREGYSGIFQNCGRALLCQSGELSESSQSGASGVCFQVLF